MLTSILTRYFSNFCVTDFSCSRITILVCGVYVYLHYDFYRAMPSHASAVYAVVVCLSDGHKSVFY